ncbi:MAG TPA: DUF4912 domain-containing protein [Chthoniobacterales bacterium]|nr:DUF4912 domain-containing protein [Chthoniobacterales bacterium]
MPEEAEPSPQPEHRGEYRISNGPVVRFARSDPKFPSDLPEVELPRVYGAPLLFAIARDPKTIFTYWNIDWSTIFENSAPVDRQVHLRIHRSDGTEEPPLAVEPMAGNSYVTVSAPGETYRVEIGYYYPAAVWNSVTKSEAIEMPVDRVTENDNVDLATIPFHLSFQRLIDAFRSSNGDNITQIVSGLQKRAVSEEERALLTPEEWELIRGMDLSVEDMAAARDEFLSHKSKASRRQLESLLGFGGSSPAFSESSWG